MTDQNSNLNLHELPRLEVVSITCSKQSGQDISLKLLPKLRNLNYNKWPLVIPKGIGKIPLVLSNNQILGLSNIAHQFLKLHHIEQFFSLNRACLT